MRRTTPPCTLRLHPALVESGSRDSVETAKTTLGCAGNIQCAWEKRPVFGHILSSFGSTQHSLQNQPRFSRSRPKSGRSHRSGRQSYAPGQRSCAFRLPSRRCPLCVHLGVGEGQGAAPGGRGTVDLNNRLRVSSGPTSACPLPPSLADLCFKHGNQQSEFRELGSVSSPHRPGRVGPLQRELGVVLNKGGHDRLEICPCPMRLWARMVHLVRNAQLVAPPPKCAQRICVAFVGASRASKFTRI